MKNIQKKMAEDLMYWFNYYGIEPSNDLSELFHKMVSENKIRIDEACEFYKKIK